MAGPDNSLIMLILNYRLRVLSLNGNISNKNVQNKEEDSSSTGLFRCLKMKISFMEPLWYFKTTDWLFSISFSVLFRTYGILFLFNSSFISVLMFCYSLSTSVFSSLVLIIYDPWVIIQLNLYFCFDVLFKVVNINLQILIGTTIYLFLESISEFFF